MMRCPACVADGKVSRLDMVRGPTRKGKLETFWDEADHKHIHDHAVRQLTWRCSNGHYYQEVSITASPY